MTEAGGPAVEAPARRGPGLWPGVALLLGAGMLVLLLLQPGIDESWENHPAHFWLVLGAASLSIGLGYTVGVAARSRRDARLFLVSLAFVSAAGFLGLHALATPGVLLGKNGGFELATPFGIAVAGVFAAASGLPLDSMLVETDTPFLSPVPHRGKPCEPAFVVDTARKLAEVQGTDLETVAAVTTANFDRLFGPR